MNCVLNYLFSVNLCRTLSYEQQSLSVNDIFPALLEELIVESVISIKISTMHDEEDDEEQNDSCFTDDDELQFGEIEY